MPDLELPTNLVREMAEYDAPDAPCRTWLADLPAVVEAVSREWSLDVGRPFQPGGVTSWTAPARTATGERVVLKIGWRHDEALHEADGLAAWNGKGALRLLDHRVLDHTTALLLEASEPGTRSPACATCGPTSSRRNSPVHRTWIRAWREPVWSCSANYPGRQHSRGCCARTFTPTTCCLPRASRGW
ncbi:possible streptomycin 6-kinase, N-terminal [Rhodococcus jostii RHA1]|uniref:Possible streptomycin 6-kinase, N-terminal n=1 Tax=Rhodococcus jostii (strain RHA1) TaxID=101510 RepID=Q0SDP9_RHOJR|nr:possible streptomycin 6-kinase, N-terminal [Rhodococcus jostii RHA1]